MSDWRVIDDYPKYMVNEFGEVKSLYKNKKLKPLLDVYGYHHVNLYKDGNMKSKKIHRLVMEAFVGPSQRAAATHFGVSQGFIYKALKYDKLVKGYKLMRGSSENT